MWEKEIDFVKEQLIKQNGDNSPRQAETFRHRHEHLIRVLHFCRKIIDSMSYDERNVLNIDAIELAAIFHDVGYGVESFKNSHGIEGSEIFKGYALKNGFPNDLVDTVYNMILVHQDKTLLEKDDISNELRVLMEADMLDEEGALGISWDLLTLGYNGCNNYEEAYQKVMNYSAHILSCNPFRYPYSRNMWIKKQKLISDFLDDFKSSL